LKRVARALARACAACAKGSAADDRSYRFVVEAMDGVDIASALGQIEGKQVEVAPDAAARAKCARITIRFMEPAPTSRIERSVVSGLADAGLALTTTGPKLQLGLAPGQSPDCLPRVTATVAPAASASASAAAPSATTSAAP
jgi:hypothetical protein